MSDYIIYGVDSRGERMRVANTPSARAAKEYRDRKNDVWKRIIVCGAEGDLGKDQLDQLAALESRLFKLS